MIKCTYNIDGEKYSAVFITTEEEKIFVEDNRRDNAKIVLLSCEEITIDQLINDLSLEYLYRVEIVAAVLLPHIHAEKWTTLETMLHTIGVTIP